jgi:hypothetical protein
VFAEFVKTEIKNDGKTTRTVHTGKAQCMQEQCKAKGKKGLHSFSTQSRYHLKVHYDKVSADCSLFQFFSLSGLTM